MPENTNATVESLEAVAETMDPSGPPTPPGESDEYQDELNAIAQWVKDVMAKNLPKCSTPRQVSDLERAVSAQLRAKLATLKMANAIRSNNLPRTNRDDRIMGTPWGGGDNYFDLRDG